MATLTPFRIAMMAQDGATQNSADQDGAVQDDAAAEGNAAATEQQVQEPLLSGTDTALWVGFGAFISIFLIVIIAIIRARVIKPAERMARETDFFEPAGTGAEITFDDAAQAEVKRSRKKDRKKKPDKKTERAGLDRDAPTEVAPENIQEKAQQNTDGPDDIVAEPEPQPAPEPKMAEIAAAIDSAAVPENADDKKTAPFAGLFSSDGTPDETPAYEHGEPAAALADANDVATAPDDVRIDHLPEIDQSYWDTERQRQEAADYERAEEERRLALEEAARARADADAELARREAVREADMRAAASERREADAALERRMQAMSEMQGKLDAMADRLSRDADGVEARVGAVLEKKFEGLSNDLHHRLHTAAAEIDKMQQDADANAVARSDDGGALIIATHIEALQKATEAALTGLSERIDALSATQATDAAQPEELRRLNTLLAERTAPAVAGTLQLGDLVRSALPADRYAFDRELSNGAKADCVITRPGAAAFAIDARYPAEAFDRYARADEKARDHAATAYRRAILRHMIFVAEKLIAPNETADFAILFVPNDTIFTDLHQNFADIVQDSYRARIWIASPTSLMATLHMMSAASQMEGDIKTGADDELKAAVAALTDRIGALEENLTRASAPPQTASIVETTPADQPTGESILSEDFAPLAEGSVATPSEVADASVIETEEAEVEILGAGSAPADENAATDEGGATRPPFPLR